MELVYKSGSGGDLLLSICARYSDEVVLNSSSHGCVELCDCDANQAKKRKSVFTKPTQGKASTHCA